jgi:hypothetical protein
VIRRGRETERGWRGSRPSRRKKGAIGEEEVVRERGLGQWVARWRLAAQRGGEAAGTPPQPWATGGW